MKIKKVVFTYNDSDSYTSTMSFLSVLGIKYEGRTIEGKYCVCISQKAYAEDDCLDLYLGSDFPIYSVFSN